MNLTWKSFLLYAAFCLIPAILVIFWEEIKLLKKGMVPRWWKQSRLCIDKVNGNIVVKFSSNRESISLMELKSVTWNLIDWPGSTDYDNSSFFARQSLSISLSSGETKVLRFDIENPKVFVDELRQQGIAVKFNPVND